MRKGRIVLAAATALLSCRPLFAQHAFKQLEGAAGLSSPAPVAGQAGKGPEAKPETPLDALKSRIAQEASARPLFQVTEGTLDGKPKSYLVIPEGKLGKPYLFQATIEKAPGSGFVMSTVIDDTFLVSFVRAGRDKLQLWRRQTDLRADTGTAELRAIERTVQDYLLGQVDIKASDAQQGYVVVSADELFVRDATSIGLRLQRESEELHLAFSQKDSLLLGIKAFPKNLDAQVQLVYDATDPKHAPRLESGNTVVVMRFSISALPEDPSFAPRAADERVGYFTTNFRDLSRPDLKGEHEPRVHFINRWNLQKKEPAAPVSEVKDPIVFWLEDTVPEKYRDSIRQGVLAWNAAFEAAGFKNAVVVRQVPAPGQGNQDMSAEERASFDPADISYNLVRWYVEGFGGAVGPSRAHPLTGQIYHAVISMSDSMTRLSGGLNLAAPAVEGDKDSKGAREARARREASLARALAGLPGRGDDAETERFIQESVFETAAHEVGHTLGLEHNFKASQYLSREELGKDGLYTASMMDDNPAYLAPPGQKQGRYFQDRLGPYDAWAIEYGYKDLPADEKARQAELRAIAGRANTDRALAFGNDEDVRTDVDARQFDMGRGALPFARSRVELANHLWARLASSPAAPDEDAKRQRDRYAAGFGAYFTAAEAALPLVGGWRSRRGPGRQFEPVPVTEQRQALEFLEKNILAAKPFEVAPEFLQRLGNDRLNSNHNPRFRVEGWVASLQESTLNRLLSARTITEVAGNEVNAGPEGRLSPSELFDRVRRSVWSELERPSARAIPLFRRNLQQAHATRLAELMNDTNLPTDARAAARRDLQRVERDSKRAAAGKGVDETTRLHLQEIARSAGEALSADSKR